MYSYKYKIKSDGLNQCLKFHKYELVLSFHEYKKTHLLILVLHKNCLVHVMCTIFGIVAKIYIFL